MIRKALNDPSLEVHLSTLSPDGITWFAMGPGNDEIQMRGILIHGSRVKDRQKA